jgi:hypothetical protein
MYVDRFLFKQLYFVKRSKIKWSIFNKILKICNFLIFAGMFFYLCVSIVML